MKSAFLRDFGERLALFKVQVCEAKRERERTCAAMEERKGTQKCLSLVTMFYFFSLPSLLFIGLESFLTLLSYWLESAV